VTRPRAIAVVAAHQEEGTVGRTVKQLLALPDVARVLVAADGSTDRTAAEARGAGAVVVTGTRRAGKGRAVEAALDLAGPAEIYLLVDADVGDTAAEAGSLLDAVTSGRLEVAVGRLPPQPGGGFGLVKRMAAAMIRASSGFAAQEPLSGQRALTAKAMAAARPLADGFGLETAMTIDLVRLGFRVGEVDVAMRHRPTGRGISGFSHRGRQGMDILRAVLPRMLRLR
jgi:glycosyltransferase involved in cell wall biosynthesis